MKISSAIIVLSFASVSLLETVSASNEQEENAGTALRGGVVDEVLHVFRDLKKKKNKKETSVAKGENGEKVEAKAAKQNKNNKNNKNKAGGGNNRADGCNVSGKGLTQEQIDDICNNRAGGTTINNRMGQCDGTRQAMVIGKDASVNEEYGHIEIEPGTECFEEEGDSVCMGCCCAGGYMGSYPPGHARAGQWRRACLVTSNYAAPVGLCINPEGIPVDVSTGGGLN